MKVTNAQIWKLSISKSKDKPVIDKLAELYLPASYAYKRNKLVKEITSRFQEIVKVHDDIIIRLGEKNEDGNYTVDPNNSEVFNKFLAEERELMNIEEEIDLTKFPVEVLEGLEMDFTESEALSFLIDFGEDENNESDSQASEDIEKEPNDK